MAPSDSDPAPPPHPTPFSCHSQNDYLLISFLFSLSFVCVEGSVLPMLADEKVGRAGQGAGASINTISCVCHC